MVTWISKRLRKRFGATDRDWSGSEAIQLEKIRERRRLAALDPAIGRPQPRRDAEPGGPFRERGSQHAVRRALLAALDQDEISGLRDIPHAWSVTRQHLRLLARQLERQTPR